MFFRKKENLSAGRQEKNTKVQLVVVLLIIFVTILLKIGTSLWPDVGILIADKNLNVLVADTTDHRYEGWSGRDSMDKMDGMMFVFKNHSQHTMVMRDMNFPIDIVWAVGIDDEGNKCSLNKFGLRKMVTGLYHSCMAKVVDIAPNVKTEVDVVQNELIPYFAREKSTIVFELKAGFAKENGLKIGDIIEIKN